jgi:D-xylulose reductase
VQGGMGKNEITWPIAAMCSKELTVKGSFRYSQGDYELAVKLLETQQVKVKELITGTVEFGDAEKAFESVRKAEGIKTLIKGPE